MKTHNEILVDSRQLEALGRQFSNDYRRIVANGAEAVRVSPVLVKFPESRFTGVDGVLTRERWIEAGVVDGALNYRLLEVERQLSVSGEFVNDSGPALIIGSESAFEVLYRAEDRNDTERLGEALAPFLARKENDVVGSINPTVVKEIESIVVARDLPPSLRIRTKAGITDLLEGRLAPSEFIATAVKRQRWREDVREVQFERMVIGMGGGGE